MKKISRLSYVIIFCSLSYIFLIGKGSSYYSTAGELVYDALTNYFTKYSYKVCTKTSIEERIQQRKNIFPDECFDNKFIIEIDNVKINANDLTLEEIGYVKKFNDDPKNKFVYRLTNNSQGALIQAQRPTSIIMWSLFLLSLPLIWFSRDFSIIIVNFCVRLVSGGWKKL